MAGPEGTVSKVLDTQYVVRLKSGATLRVPFALVTVPDDNLDMETRTRGTPRVRPLTRFDGR
ncbi:hypothetical protein NKG05_02795 [Oerskovia sp. M15]